MCSVGFGCFGHGSILNSKRYIHIVLKVQVGIFVERTVIRPNTLAIILFEIFNFFQRADLKSQNKVMFR